MRLNTVCSRFSDPPRSGVVRHRRRGHAVTVVAVALLSTSLPASRCRQSRPQGAADPKVIRDWNAVAFDTIVVDAGKANAEAFMWFAFEQAAVYNAVVGITRHYELYNWNARGPRGASPQAAAAVAAHDVLLEYFPASQGRLDTALAASLAEIPDGPTEEAGDPLWRTRRRPAHRAPPGRRSFRAGHLRCPACARRLAPDPNRPRPRPFAPFFDPWLSQLRPLLLDSPSQFRPGPPPAMTSQTYTADFNEVKAVGSATSAVRTPEQTATARFIAGSTIPLVSSSLRDLAARHQLDISDSARLFAAVAMSAADGVITSWDSKFEFGFWRPVTAIQLADTDGNPDTLPDPGWLPLIRNSAVPRLHQRSHVDRGRSHPRFERNARTWGRPH